MLKNKITMKKTVLLKLLVVVYAIAFILFMTSCEKHECKRSHEKSEHKVIEGTFNYTDKGRPTNMIKYNEIVNMLEAYDSTRKFVLEKSLGFEDTRVNTYPIEELKNYLGYIENLCVQKNIPLTGINIISAAYPNKKSNSKEAGYQTLIFMPTTTIDGEYFVTFDPLKSVKGNPITFKSILAKKGYKWLYDNSKVSKNKETIVEKSFQENEISSGSNRLASRPPM